MHGVNNCKAQAKGKVRGGFVMDFMLNKYLYLFNCFAMNVFRTFVYFTNIYIRTNATDTLIACLAKNYINRC